MYKLYRSISTYIPSKELTWCYKNGYYQNVPSKKIFSYGKFIQLNQGINRKVRQQKLIEYWNQNN